MLALCFARPAGIEYQNLGADLLIPGIGRERVDWEMGNQEILLAPQRLFRGRGGYLAVGEATASLRGPGTGR